MKLRMNYWRFHLVHKSIYELLIEAVYVTFGKRETVFSHEEITSMLNKINDNEAMAQMW